LSIAVENGVVDAESASRRADPESTNATKPPQPETNPYEEGDGDVC